MTAEDIQDKIKGFLANEAGVDASSLSTETRLFSSRLLNSLDILNIVSFLEETYDIKVGTWEISLERFDTLAGIADYVKTKVA